MSDLFAGLSLAPSSSREENQQSNYSAQPTGYVPPSPATLNGNAMHFAHSISLVPIDEAILRYHGHRENAANTISPTLTEAFGLGYPYQIHNDALAFLSGDVGVQVAQQSQTAQPVQQPPGLLF